MNYQSKQAYYTFKIHETGHSYDAKATGFLKWFNIFIRGFVGLILLWCLIFGFDLLFSLPFITIFVLGLLFVGSFIFNGKCEDIPSEMIISFYDDYFTLHSPKKMHARSITKMQTETIAYQDLTSFTTDKFKTQLKFFGTINRLSYRYDKSGSLIQRPYENKTYNGLTIVYINFDSLERIVDEFQRHSPITFTNFGG